MTFEIIQLMSQIWIDFGYFGKSFTSLVSEFLDFRFVIFFTREIFDLVFSAELYFVNQTRAWIIISHLKGTINSFPFPFIEKNLLHPSSLTLKNRLSHRGLIFQVRRNAGSLKSPVLFFFVRLLHKKVLRAQAKESSDDRFIICTRRKYIPVTCHRKEGKILFATSCHEDY